MRTASVSAALAAPWSSMTSAAPMTSSRSRVGSRSAVSAARTGTYTSSTRRSVPPSLPAVGPRTSVITRALGRPPVVTRSSRSPSGKPVVVCVSEL